MSQVYDILVLGAGAAGLPAAIFASRAGARVLVVEAADRIGGSFHLSSGQMSAAGTRLQAAKGIHDTPQMHFDDVMRISKGTADPAIVRLAVENAADTLHWLLDAGFEALPDHPVITLGHEPYLVPRSYWGAEGGRTVMNAILPLYAAEQATGRVETWTNAELVRLTLDDAGGVTGAIVKRDGAEVAVSAGAVLLATGGYTANADLFPQLSMGKKLHGGGYPYGKGAGLVAGVEAGGEIVHQDKFLPGFAGVEDPAENGGITGGTITTPQDREPWEVYVDVRGKRFMREDEESIDLRERALLEQPDLTFWALYDSATLRDAPPFFTAPADVVAARFESLPGYKRADTIAELATLIGLDADTLVDTIDTYNAQVAAGTPDPLGRTHRPTLIAEAPFYAVRHVGWSITAFAGLKIDAELRVLNRDGAPIPNLYAAGEVTGFGTTSGNAFVGGMSVTPAMTFGRMLGARLGASVRVSETA
jgi:fumarate reductase flavoprotein subunit